MAGEWKEVSLGEVADILVGFPFKSELYSIEGIRLLRGDNIAQGMTRWDGAKMWPKERCAGLEHFLLKEGDVVLAMDRPWIAAGLKYAEIHAHDLPSLLVQRVARLRGTKDAISKYIKYVVGSPQFTEYVLSIQTGTAVPHISASQIQSYRFRCPPRCAQEQIASILGSLDDKIELTRRTSETLESMARALFKSWFVDFDPVRAKAEGRTPTDMDADTAKLFPSGFEESELGPIPKGWSVESLGDHVNITKGVSYRSDELRDSDVGLVTLKSFRRGGGYSDNGIKSYTGLYAEGQVVCPGELILSYTDVTQAAEVIGRPAIVRPSTIVNKMVASLDVGIVRPTGWISREFVYHSMQSQAFLAHALAHSNGSTVLHLQRNAAETYRLAVPPHGVVQAFTSCADTIIRRSSVCHQQAWTLSSIRDELLPRLLSGSLPIHDSD